MRKKLCQQNHVLAVKAISKGERMLTAMEVWQALVRIHERRLLAVAYQHRGAMLAGAGDVQCVLAHRWCSAVAMDGWWQERVRYKH
jgi:hypothetical protein